MTQHKKASIKPKASPPKINHLSYILIVEDEPTQAAVIRRTIRAANPNVKVKVTGSLQEYRSAIASSLPDIVLMDINLPDGKAFEVLTSPLEAGSFPIVVMTGYGNEKIAVKAMKKGALDYVVKSPEAFKAILRTLERAFREWKLIQERKRAEEAIRQSEEQFKTLFMSISEGFYISEVIYDDNGNPCDYRYVEVNPKFEQIIGLSRDQIVGKRYKELVSEDSTQWLDIYCRVASTGTPLNYEFYSNEYHSHFGTYSYTPIKGQVIVFVLDITERQSAEQAGKRAEKALRESEQRLSFHLENSPMATVEWDSNFIVTRWGGEAERIFGWSSAETIGKPIMDLHIIYDEDIPIVQKVMERLNDGVSKHVVSTNRNCTKDGKVIYCEWYNSVLLNAQGKMVSVMSQILDITERKQAAEERNRLLTDIQQHDAELDAIFTALPYLVSLHEKDGKYLRVNPTVKNVFGFDPVNASREEIAQRLKAHFPDGQPLTPRNMPSNRAFAGEAVHNIEYIITDVNGNECTLLYNAIPWKVDGEVRGAIFAQEDITERKRAEEASRRAEEAVKRSNEYFRALTENALDIIAVVNKKGVIEYVSPSVVRYLGYTQEELIGKSGFSVIRPIDLPRAIADFGKAIFIKDRTIPNSFRMRHKDGSERVLEGFGNNLFDNPAVAGFVMNIRDITERKRAEEEIRNSHEQLIQLINHQDMVIEDERARISREIHDELGQSLTALKIDLNWTRDNIDKGSAVKQKLDTMLDIVSNTIKDVQRIASDLRPSILDDLGLVPAIEWYCEEFEKRTGIRCETSLLEDIQNHNSQLNLVLFRLIQEALTNVVRHAHATIVEIKLYQTNKYLILEVIDNGIGIDEKKINSNISLGIMGMRERTRQFNGRVEITSFHQQGTEVTVLIELEREP